MAGEALFSGTEAFWKYAENHDIYHVLDWMGPKSRILIWRRYALKDIGALSPMSFYSCSMVGLRFCEVLI